MPPEFMVRYRALGREAGTFGKRGAIGSSSIPDLFHGLLQRSCVHESRNREI